MTGFERYAALVPRLRFWSHRPAQGGVEPGALVEFTCRDCGQPGLALGGNRQTCDACYLDRHRESRRRYDATKRSGQASAAPSG